MTKEELKKELENKNEKYKKSLEGWENVIKSLDTIKSLGTQATLVDIEKLFEPSQFTYLCDLRNQIDMINAKNLALLPKSIQFADNILITLKDYEISEQLELLELALNVTVYIKDICKLSDRAKKDFNTIKLFNNQKEM